MVTVSQILDVIGLTFAELEQKEHAAWQAQVEAGMAGLENEGNEMVKRSYAKGYAQAVNDLKKLFWSKYWSTEAGSK